jgi:hypothetical protein
MRIIVSCFSFIGLSRADDPAVRPSPCINHDENATLDFPEAADADLTVIAADIGYLDHIAVKNLDGSTKIDFMFDEIAFLLGRIPFE